MVIKKLPAYTLTVLLAFVIVRSKRYPILNTQCGNEGEWDDGIVL